MQTVYRFMWLYIVYLAFCNLTNNNILHWPSITTYYITCFQTLIALIFLYQQGLFHEQMSTIWKLFCLASYQQHHYTPIQHCTLMYSNSLCIDSCLIQLISNNLCFTRCQILTNGLTWIKWATLIVIEMAQPTTPRTAWEWRSNLNNDKASSQKDCCVLLVYCDLDIFLNACFEDITLSTLPW